MGNNNNQHQKYFLADGTEVPSVTQVLSVLGKPALIHWAWQLGMAGKDYRKERDGAASAGTLAHAYIKAYLKGETLTEDFLLQFSRHEIDQAENAFIKFLEMFKERNFEPKLIETPLVSEALRVGGTMDTYGIYDGKYEIWDFKTAKDIYPEYFYQLAGYKLLLEEHGHKVDRVRIVQLGRDEHLEYKMGVKDAQDLQPETEIFLSCLKIHQMSKQLSKCRYERS
jgi:hypothetical protein